jgi:hypothetical protein
VPGASFPVMKGPLPGPGPANVRLRAASHPAHRAQCVLSANSQVRRLRWIEMRAAGMAAIPVNFIIKYRIARSSIADRQVSWGPGARPEGFRSGAGRMRDNDEVAHDGTGHRELRSRAGGPALRVRDGPGLRWWRANGLAVATSVQSFGSRRRGGEPWRSHARWILRADAAAAVCRPTRLSFWLPCR